MRPKIILSVLVGLALLLSFGVAVKDAKADAIMFPWIVKSDTVSTLVSIVNTCGPIGTYGGGLLNLELHYEYWYKVTNANGQTEICQPHSDKLPTSKDDIITFDTSCNINNGEALFGDPSPYGGASFCLNEPSPRRAFLLVDNNTPAYLLNGVNADGTLYGEAIVMEIQSGAAWGYSAYNAWATGQTDGQSGPIYFFDSFDALGEVVRGSSITATPAAALEWTQTVFMPPDVMSTRMFVTPTNTPNVMVVNSIAVPPIPVGSPGDQRIGNANVIVQISTMEPNTPCPLPSTAADLVDGIYDSDENPMDGTVPKNIVCTTGDNLSAFINPGNYNSWVLTGEQGWGYLALFPGNVDAVPFDTVPDNPTDEAIIGKLEYTAAGLTIDSVTVPGAVNNFVWLRNSTTLLGPGGVNNMYNFCDSLP